MLKHKTSLGTISLSKNIMGKILSEALGEFDGKVQLCTPKGKVPTSAPKNSYLIEIEETEAGLSIKMYVLIKFGTSIKMVTNRLVNSIREQLILTCGINPANISVVVVGTVAHFSKHIIKRNIEVTK